MAPVRLIAEIGINHNGDPALAYRLVEQAARAGWTDVKLQIRTPALCVPASQLSVTRDTPWGVMTYLEYRERMELPPEVVRGLVLYARGLGLDVGASVWDPEAVDRATRLGFDWIKVPSAGVTDEETQRALLDRWAGRVIMSTGMSTLEQVDDAVNRLRSGCDLSLAYCVSEYPCPIERIDLSVMDTLRGRYGLPVGYSGHEAGLAVSVVAAALGAAFIERHVTLDRTMWGSDHAASLEPEGMRRLARDVRVATEVQRDGRKRVTGGERSQAAKLRRVQT